MGKRENERGNKGGGRLLRKNGEMVGFPPPSPKIFHVIICQSPIGSKCPAKRLLGRPYTGFGQMAEKSEKEGNAGRNRTPR